MVYTPEVTFVNQRIQIGAESTSALGTGVACSKSLLCFDWTPGIQADVTFYRPTGHKYDSESEENMEWMESAMTGWMDYNGLIYPAGGIFGASSPVAHGASAVAKDWIFTPPIVGTIVPQTYTWQQGDAVRARSFTYGIFADFGYKIARKTTTVSGKLLGQPLTDGITLTASPTAIALAPIVGKQVNVYIDSTSAGIGTTQLLRAFSLDYACAGMYGIFWPLNRATVGFGAHVDLAPKTTVKLKLEADATGMGLLPDLQQGTTVYMRVQAQGALIDNLQTVTLGVQSSGTFTLTYKSQTTTALAYNATAATVQAALLALGGSVIPAGGVVVSGSTGGPYTLDFSGALANDVTAITGTFSALTTPGNASIAQSQVYNTFKHDMALRVGKPSTFSDEQGVYAIEWELTVIEDPLWNSGQAQQLTLTNLITAL